MLIFKKIGREVRIMPQSNGGFIVNVGCATFAYSNFEEVLGALRTYWQDPDAAETRYNEIIRADSSTLSPSRDYRHDHTTDLDWNTGSRLPGGVGGGL